MPSEDTNIRLAAFLQRQVRRKFVYGQNDCSLWLADWVLDQRGVDGAAHLRGRYRTRLGCARIIGREGSLLCVIRQCALIAGLDELSGLSEPRSGDIGVVAAMTDRGVAQVGAIKGTADRWAMLGERGLTVGPAMQLAAWRV